ncbi:uncharacterized protein LOC127579543 [Pristis pectinata]|uniref:uncharacterized protein LOC127579543 n=1 Tax=Pristis pectinata TaxID=685728 RepID=UPI00223D5FF0|nr:uncharacterized protein LOC127579543 [Pristis pectinata]
MNIVTFVSIYTSTLCTVWSLNDTERNRIDQTPNHLTVSEGRTANLTCTVSADGILDFIINWLHRPSKATNQTYILFMNQSKVNLSIGMEITRDQNIYRSMLSINNLQQGDSGTYYCELMILDPPSTGGVMGSGSRLMVTGSDSQKGKLWWLYLLICLLLFVIFFLAISCWKAKQKQSIVPSDSAPGTVLEEISGPDRSTYATLSSTTVTANRQAEELEVVYSDTVIKRTTNASTETAEYSAVKICKANPKAKSGDGDEMCVVYSQVLREEKH